MPLRGRYRQANVTHYDRLASCYDVIEIFAALIRADVAGLCGAGRQKVLDVACGTGSQSVALAEHGLLVYGLDLSRAMLRKARKKVRNLPIVLVEGDASKLPFPDGVFDATIISFALHEMPTEVAIASLREMKRVTSQYGTIIIVELNPWGTLFRRFAGYLLRFIEPEYFAHYMAAGLEAYLKASNLSTSGTKQYYFGLITIKECNN
jgi:ubiquinone/menaquinone biosynthesis C-methylase UbiE